MGSALITYGLTMTGLMPLITSNPFTSGPAALAAGIALTALGAALGAAAGGKGGGGSTQSLAAATPQPINISRLIIDPNASMRDRVGRSAAGTMAIAGAVPGQTIQVIGINSPQGQQLIGTANDRYSRRRS